MPFRRKKQATPPAPEPRPPGPPPDELVRLYLRGQNLEQILQVDEAVAIYEQVVAAGFDAAGPYDRLIAIYSGRNAHSDVHRVADAALRWVRAIDEKKQWYESFRQRGAEF